MRRMCFGVVVFLLPASVMADSTWRNEIRLQIHDVSQWVDSLSEFPSVGPAIVRPLPESLVTDEKFVETVIAAVPRTNWNGGGGYTLQCQNGLLIVRATASVHRAVAKHLAQLKASQR